MTTQEFSDAFDTLLNSYRAQAAFGEGASKFDITLDEYEKSVFLTQAQDMIVKSYFTGRLNPTGEGFDDSERRQVDFSSLITKAEVRPVARTSSTTFYVQSEPAITFNWNFSGSSYPTRIDIKTFYGERLAPQNDILNIINTYGDSCGLNVGTINWLVDLADDYSDRIPWLCYGYYEGSDFVIRLWVAAEGTSLDNWDEDLLDNSPMYYPTQTPAGQKAYTLMRNQLISMGNIQHIEEDILGRIPYWKDLDGISVDKTVEVNILSPEGFDERGKLYQLPKDVLMILNEQVRLPSDKTLIVKPISYREYDREMSKAYAQPLKKQAWRLFHNQSTGYDITSEIILNQNLNYTEDQLTYKIRYIKRPTPIILVDLPNNLDIDGYSTRKECSLNPSLHYDILQRAFELAITTRGGGGSSNNKAEES